jgi:hypothetical protein
MTKDPQPNASGAEAFNPDESAYEGRTDNPAPDTNAGVHGPSTGTGTGQGHGPDTATKQGESAREGGGASSERS